MISAATTIQAAERGRRARFAFALVRDLIIGAQAAIRGCFKRKIAHREREERLRQYRTQMFSLWNFAHTPLAYRAKFWHLINGSGFLHLAITEDELLRLWGDLGLGDFHNSDIIKAADESGQARRMSLSEHQYSTLSSHDSPEHIGKVSERKGAATCVVH